MSTPETRAVDSWRLARELVPIYIELAPPELPPPCTLQAIEADTTGARWREITNWFDQVDAQVKPAEFRRRLRLATGNHLGDVLELILDRLLTSREHNPELVQKVDEACFDYFCLHAPPEFLDRRASANEIGTVLAAVLVHAHPGGGAPRGLAQLAERLGAIQSLPELAASPVLKEARTLRLADARTCFERNTLIAFTEFHHVAHLTRARLAKADAEFILRAAPRLAKMGVVTLDCRAAGRGEHEPLMPVLMRMRAICAAKQSLSNDSLRLLTTLRPTIEKLLADAPVLPAMEPPALPEKPAAMAVAAASAGTHPASFAYDVVDEFCARCYPLEPRRRPEAASGNAPMTFVT